MSPPGPDRNYHGVRLPNGATSVSVDGRPLDLRQDLRTPSATAFDWGYAGAGGPSQLALAMLADHWADDHKARRYYQHFVRRVIRHLPSPAWRMTGAEIDAALPQAAL